MFQNPVRLGLSIRFLKLIHSVPSDYDDSLAYYTHRGYRVIACATKHIPNLSWIKAQKMKRSEAECDLEFAGFIVFENKLKQKTISVINELKLASIRTIMCTGDNILTAISVARECGLIEKERIVFAPHLIRNGGHTELRWESIEDTELILDDETLLVFFIPSTLAP